jgi:hypothetical protein
MSEKLVKHNHYQKQDLKSYLVDDVMIFPADNNMAWILAIVGVYCSFFSCIWVLLDIFIYY